MPKEPTRQIENEIWFYEPITSACIEIRVDSRLLEEDFEIYEKHRKRAINELAKKVAKQLKTNSWIIEINWDKRRVRSSQLIVSKSKCLIKKKKQ